MSVYDIRKFDDRERLREYMDKMGEYDTVVADCLREALDELDRVDNIIPPVLRVNEETWERLQKCMDEPKAITPSLFQQRAAEKAASREEDARALASGEKTVEDLRRENGAFAFPRGQVRLRLGESDE